ncbi:hypothetical protein N8T08_001714 [Aspergillus melleus]|uniref:Uncharacterized protein n=1 Tax=Aspergillus melleus TaxID=138277 RepID=A0ACC3ANB1_9EURO|nr:hypothetical protein N8T08_001714 [Aspergillus melleus]
MSILGWNRIPSCPITIKFILAPEVDRDILAVREQSSEHAEELASGFDASDKKDQSSRLAIFTKRATSIIARKEPVLLHREFAENPD